MAAPTKKSKHSPRVDPPLRAAAGPVGPASRREILASAGNRSGTTKNRPRTSFWGGFLFAPEQRLSRPLASGCRARAGRPMSPLCRTLDRMSESDTQLAKAIAALLSATAAAAATPQAPETVLTVQEAAERLKISRGLVYSAIKDGTIRSVRIGKRRLIPTGEIQRLIDSAS